MIKKTLATSAIITLLSTSAFAFGGIYDNSISQKQTAQGGEAIAGAVSIDASQTSLKSNTNASSKNNIKAGDVKTNLSVEGDVFQEARNVANAPIILTPNSNFECTQVSGGGIQSTGSGVSANIASDSESCIALKLVDTVKELEPRHPGLQMSMLCTSEQARKGLENHGEGLADKYCKDRNTYLGFKPIVSGVKEIILLPVTFVKWVIKS